MKILVTGANGYLGTGIVRNLLDDAMEVIAADYETNDVDQRAERYSADIFSISDPYNFFHKPDVLLHLAWRDGFVHNSDTHLEDLSKHYSFLKKMIVKGVSRVAVMGSMHEIGFYEGCINEHTPANPENLYGISKNALRGCVSVLCRNTNVKYQWLRGYYIVGDSEHGSSVFNKLCMAEKRGEALFPFTSGQNQYDFLDYEEFCMRTAAAVEQDLVLGTINICSGVPEKLAERVDRFIREHGFHIQLDYGKYPNRPYDSKAVWGNSEKIDQILRNKKGADHKAP